MNHCDRGCHCRFLFLIVLATAAAFCSVFGNEPNSAINVPALAYEPNIDGQIDPQEWSGASAGLFGRGQDGQIAQPSGIFYIGRRDGFLYLAGIVKNLPQMPVANHDRRDAPLWQEDAIQVSFKTPNQTVHFLVNAKGTLYDSLNNEASWNGQWRIAARQIGQEAYVVFEGVKADVERGFSFEAALDLQASGITTPKEGDRWGLQVGFLTQNRSQSVWNGYAGQGFETRFGQMIWGGLPTQLLYAQLYQKFGKIELEGNSGAELSLKIQRDDQTEQHVLSSGAWRKAIPLVGGRKYTIAIEGHSYYYDIQAHIPLQLPVAAAHVPSKNAFYVGFFPEKLETSQRYPIVLKIVKEDKMLWHQAVDLSAIKKRESYWIDYTQWPDGWYELVIDRKDNDGSIVEVGRISLKKPKKPAWANFQLPPNAPLVPKPFEPIEADDFHARVFGRVYYVGKSLFLDQVQSAGENILAAPLHFKGKVNHKPVDFETKSWKMVFCDAEKVVYEGIAYTENLEAKSVVTIEFDGMARFDWTIKPISSEALIENFVLVVPVRKEVAKFYQHSFFEDFTFSDLKTWNKAGALPSEGWSGRFTPFFWLGDYERGIQWFAETRADWLPADPMKFISVEPQNTSVDLVLHLSDKPRVLSKEWSMNFGLMASPVRPRPSEDDLSGNRIAVGHQAVLYMQPNEEWRTSAIILPGGPEDFPQEGCVELLFRIDELGQPATFFLTAQNSGGSTGFELCWNGQDAILLRSHGSPTGRTVHSAWPVSLETQQWHRLVFNYGRTVSVYLNGNLVGKTNYTGPLDSFDRLRYHQIGGGARMSLRGIRLSNIHRPADFHIIENWKPDNHTLYLDRMQFDPTIMGVTDPEVGGLANPGYLRGNWLYDSQNRVLSAEQPRQEMTKIEHIHRFYRARNAILFHWSNNICGHGGPAQTEALTKLFDVAKKLNLRLLPYTPAGMTDKDPAFEDYKYELSGDPLQEPQPVWIELGERLFGAVPGSDISKYELWRINEIMKLGFGGLYMDGWFYVGPAFNLLLDIGAYDAITGRPVPYFPIWLKRQQMKDVARIIQSYDPHALIFAHNSAGSQLPMMSFVTDASNGESLAWHPDWQNYVEPDVFAAEHLGRAFGWNSTLFAYQSNPLPAEYGLAIAGLFGTTTTCNQWGMYFERAEKIWQLSDSFDTANAQWMPFYKPDQNAFRPLDKRVLASAFVHPGKRALLLAANWSDEQKIDRRIAIDFQKLGLSPSTPIRLLNHNSQIVNKDNVIELPFKPRRLLYIWIGSNE